MAYTKSLRVVVMLLTHRSMALGLSSLSLLGITALGAAPSKAATCTFGQLVGGVCNLNVGDKVLTNFTRNSGIRFFPIGATNGFQDADTVTLTNLGSGAYDLIFSFLPNPVRNRQNINANFTLSITDPQYAFDTVSISRLPVGLAGLLTGAQATHAPGPTVTSSSIPALFGPSSGTFNGHVTSTSVNLSLLSLSLFSPINSVALSYTQKAKPKPVPGPLAILGAGTAFAFSRRIRRRVNKPA